MRQKQKMREKHKGITAILRRWETLINTDENRENNNIERQKKRYG